MLIIAWMFMGMAVLAGGLLLGDLRQEIEYNYKDRGNDLALIISEGDHHGLQETNHRKSRVILRRCS